jgi:hypothetical protein
VQWAAAEARKGCKPVELLTHNTRVDAQRYGRPGFSRSHAGMTIRF